MKQKRYRAILDVRRPRMRLFDLAREAQLSMRRHPVRSLATALGTVLGSAAFVAALGLSSTLQQQVSATFDVRRATEVLVQPDADQLDESWYTTTALDRLRRLNGVTHAGRRVVLGDQDVTRTTSSPSHSIKVIGVDPGGLAAIGPELTVGRRFDTFHETRATLVTMLSEPVAKQLNITRIGVAVFIGDRPFTVIGIFADVTHRPEMLLSAVIPAAVADRMDDGGAERDVVIETAPGAAQLIGSQARLALRPEGPELLRAVAPPDPRTLRRDVESSLTRASLALSLVALLVGSVSIGNSAASAIASRTGEIGLRRAVGARPLHVFSQLVAETTMLGSLGGLGGALLGVFVTSVVALTQGWQPVIDLRAAAITVAASATMGLAAGLLPAIRAMRIAPITALQR